MKRTYKSWATAPNFLELQEIVADACKNCGNYVRVQNSTSIKCWIHNRILVNLARGMIMQAVVHRVEILQPTAMKVGILTFLFKLEIYFVDRGDFDSSSFFLC